MIKSIFLSFLSIYFLFQPQESLSQTYNKIISDQDYYDFINTDILSDSIKVTHHVFRDRIPLHAESIYYKDSADWVKKNSEKFGYHFIFHYHTYNERIFSNYLDTIFTREDIDFFGKQLKAMKKTKIWKKPFVNSVFIDSVEYDNPEKGIGSRKMKYGVWGYSLPLFSFNRNLVLIIKSDSVSAGYYIYKRDPMNNWVLVKSFDVQALDYF